MTSEDQSFRYDSSGPAVKPQDVGPASQLAPSGPIDCHQASRHAKSGYGPFSASDQDFLEDFMTSHRDG